MNLRSLTLPLFALTAMLILGTTPAMAAQDKIYTGFLSSLAVDGHDPVAYFTLKTPTKGSSNFTLKHQGATWRFASLENLEKFRANPAAYAPKYGGYCAWAVSQGYTAKGDPKFWRIVDGKLYLNYNAEIQTRWEKDIPGFIRKAEKNWPRVIK